MFPELPIKKLEYLRRVCEAVRSLKLYISTAKKDVFMVAPFPRSLSVYHDEFDLVICPPYRTGSVHVLMLVTRTVLIGYPVLDYLVNATGVLAYNGH
jgi:hypothetical protein